MEDFIHMLTFRRPSRSHDAEAFGRRFLRPLMGKPDRFGNYFLNNGPVLFTAHYDTVHRTGGRQHVEVYGNWAGLPARSRSNCLGADCTAGIWLILKMIEAGVPASFAIFADEEIGGLGSAKFAQTAPDFDAVISLDRKGVDSIITHQLGYRTASDAFADSLAWALGLDLRPDPTGSFTDSANFDHFVPECTNVSVGYYRQHTREEVQDLAHLALLESRLIEADWSILQIERIAQNEFDETDWLDFEPDNGSEYDGPWNEFGYAFGH